MSRRQSWKLETTLVLSVAVVLLGWLYYQGVNHALKRAVLNRDPLPSVDRLLRMGASVRTTDEGGTTVLMLAAYEGNLPLVQAALARGVDVNAQTHDGMTALMLGAGPRKNIVRALLAAGADVNAQDNTGKTPLMYAAHRRGNEAIRFLVSHGADVNARNKKGQTALIYAQGYPDTLRLLKQLGVGK